MAQPAAIPTPFRVHYADGSTIDVQADTPAAARKLAESDQFITKIKVIKEAVDAR